MIWHDLKNYNDIFQVLLLLASLYPDVMQSKRYAFWRSLTRPVPFEDGSDNGSFSKVAELL